MKSSYFSVVLFAAVSAWGPAAVAEPKLIAMGELKGKATHTLVIADDNDFLPETSGPNVFYVLGFNDSDFAWIDQVATGYLPLSRSREFAWLAR